MKYRHILVHYHIFKNAGSSVDAGLRSSFGHQFGTFEGAHAHDIQSREQLLAFIENNPSLLAISSHLARPPLPHSNCLPVVFLRHPLLRAYSVYQYTRKNSDQPFSSVAQNLTFSSYIEWALRKEIGSIVIRDYQVVHLSDASWRNGNILQAEAINSDLQQACQLLSDWGIVGIVEDFSRSVASLQARYGEFLPGLDLNPVWDNATTMDDASPDERVDSLHSELGDDLYHEFMKINRLDLALYHHGQKILYESEKNS